jgi:hypothetical protein
MLEKNQKVLDRFVELLDDIEQDQDLINKVGCIIFLGDEDEMVAFEWNGETFCRIQHQVVINPG